MTDPVTSLEKFIPKFLSDPYDRPARLYPALLVFMPIPILIICLYGTENMAAASLLSIAGFCGAAFLLARTARNLGKRLQDSLFKKWGGAPTTQLLRHSSSHFDAHTKERYHGILSVGLGKSMPTAEQEQENPIAADELYTAATKWLIGQTRDQKKFPLVFKENVAFGFHRNCFGLRWYGAWIGLGCLLIVLIHGDTISLSNPYLFPSQLLHFTIPCLLALVVSMLMIIAWLAFLNEGAAKQAAFAYAERLVQGCDSLVKKEKIKTDKKDKGKDKKSVKKNKPSENPE